VGFDDFRDRFIGFSGVGGASHSRSAGARAGRTFCRPVRRRIRPEQTTGTRLSPDFQFVVINPLRVRAARGIDDVFDIVLTQVVLGTLRPIPLNPLEIVHALFSVHQNRNESSAPMDRSSAQRLPEHFQALRNAGFGVF
jgi:hypothetical protein